MQEPNSSLAQRSGGGHRNRVQAGDSRSRLWYGTFGVICLGCEGYGETEGKRSKRSPLQFQSVPLIFTERRRFTKGERAERESRGKQGNNGDRRNIEQKNYRAEERRVLAESIESAKINVSVFKGFYKYATIKCNLGGRVNLPRCRESEFGEYLYFTFFFVAIMF